MMLALYIALNIGFVLGLLVGVAPSLLDKAVA